MAKIQKFDDNSLQALCDIIGDTGEGLTGSEIDRLLALSDIDNVAAGTTKRHRIFAALHNKQVQDDCSNNIIAFIQRVMDPIRYVKTQDVFEQRRQDLNFILSLRGYEIKEDGRLGTIAKVDTLSAAEQRAKALRTKLLDRGIHPEVLKFCQAELLQDNYFHAVFEATKSIAEKIRTLTELESDGSDLVDTAFGLKYPLLIINNLRNDTEKSEQKGFSNLLKGIFGTFRNTTGHAPKITWNISEADALDLFSMASYAHRKLDNAVRTGLPLKE